MVSMDIVLTSPLQKGSETRVDEIDFDAVVLDVFSRMVVG
jgi:hypothetical protein